MSDKTRRVNNAGRTPEPVVRRAKPFGKDDRAARESQRRASDLFQDFGHGNGRGHAASGSFSGFGAVRSKNASILPAGVW